MPMASVRVQVLSLIAVVSLASCGDDEGETTTTTPTSTSSSTTTDAEGSSTAATTDEPGTSSTTAAGSSSGDTAADTSTGGPVGDPTYPPVDNGTCPAGSAPVVLPGAQVCAPFCNSADDMCPMAASGDAPAECTPFAGMGGSGDPCDDMTPCAMNETCNEGSCADVAFWACQLVCTDGQACPDGMQCSGFGLCGYP